MSKRLDTYEDGSGGFHVVVAHGKYLTGFGWRGKPIWGAAKDAIIFRTKLDHWSSTPFEESTDRDRAWKLLKEYPCAEQREVALFEVQPQ